MIFDLYRIKLLEETQPTLPFDELGNDRSSLLKQVIDSEPEENDKRQKWKLGKYSRIDSNAYHVKIGRNATAHRPTFKDGDFLDQESENSPYTHIVIDTEIEVVAIAQRPELARKTSTIAAQFIKLISQSELIKMRKLDIQISAIPDPRTFLESISDAYAITTFSFTATRPNPFDANKYIQKPVQEVVKKTDGKEAKLTIKGDSLTSEVLEEITKAVAASGDNATAKIIPSKGTPPTSKHLSGSQATISQISMEGIDDWNNFIEKLRRRYASIRNGH